MDLRHEHRLEEVLLRYRRDGAPAEGTRIRVEAGRLAALAPVPVGERVAALLRAADELGLVSMPALARVFPNDPRVRRSVHLRVALGWLGAHLVPSARREAP